MGPKALAAVLILASAAAASAAQAQALDPNLGGPGNATHGEVLFKQRCQICHNMPDKGGKGGLGPALYGAYGRKPGQAAGFAYSDGVKAAGFVWTPEKLNLWIQRPAAVIPGAKMVLAPISPAQDRADIIAFLKTRSTSTVQTAAAAKPAAGSKKKAKKATS